MNNKKAILLFTLIVSMQFQQAKSFNVSEYLADFAKIWAREWIAAITHETGHASMLKLLEKKQFNIHLGAEGKTFSTKLFGEKGLGNKYIKLYSIFPVGGYVDPGNIPRKTKKAKLKRIILLLAGPLAGALTYYLINVVQGRITYKSYRSNGKVNWPDILKSSFYDTSIFNHLFRNLFPILGNDGQKILEEISPYFKKIFNTAEWTICSLVIHQLSPWPIDKYVTKSLTTWKKFDIKKFNEQEIIKYGSINSMILLNKIMGLTTKFLSKGKIKSSDIDFNPLDILRLIYVSFFYIPTVINKY
jgi:hypothetical protein